jgi:hypothetical protein
MAWRRMMTTTSPYADAFDAYWRAGWRGILPLPHGQKTPPPEGYTGYGGLEPSYPDCAAWAEDGIHNIALRLPPTVIGLDVDAYDDKPGGETLHRLIGIHGPLPPTYLSTSRGDGMSGIRLYRVPPGTSFPTKLPGIELIQNYHRYAVVWPSRHPNGQLYQWIDETTGQPSITPPSVSAIPELPAAWVNGLVVEGKQQAEKANLNIGQAAEILAHMREGEPCRHILSAAGKAVAGGDRHDSYNEALLAVLGYGRRGCPGAALVTQRLKAAFIAEIANRSTPAEAKAEFHRGLIGALAIVANELPGNTCPDEVEDYIRSLDPNQPTTTAPNPDQPTTDTPTPDTDEDNPLERAVSRRYAELVITERAKEKLAALKAASATPLNGHSLTQFLDQPDEEERYRIDKLWPAEGRVLLAAAAKTGKTTLVAANLIPALVDGTPFLDTFTPTPTQRRVALFNMEVGPRTLRRWMRESDIDNADNVLIVNLRGKAGSLQLNSDAGRKQTAQFLADHETDIVILDPLAPLLASLGLDENSNSDVAQFFAWWSEMLSVAGVTDDLVVHHTGHAGDRSRGASRLLDEPDAIWTLTKGQESEPTDQDVFPLAPRFLGAYGRDVDLPARRLQFDPTTRNLALTDQTEAQASTHLLVQKYESRVMAAIERSGVGGLTAKKVMQAVGEGSLGTHKRILEHLVTSKNLEVLRDQTVARTRKGVDVFVIPGIKAATGD